MNRLIGLKPIKLVQDKFQRNFFNIASNKITYIQDLKKILEKYTTQELDCFKTQAIYYIYDYIEKNVFENFDLSSRANNIQAIETAFNVIQKSLNTDCEIIHPKDFSSNEQKEVYDMLMDRKLNNPEKAQESLGLQKSIFIVCFHKNKSYFSSDSNQTASHRNIIKLLKVTSNQEKASALKALGINKFYGDDINPIFKGKVLNVNKGEVTFLKQFIKNNNRKIILQGIFNPKNRSLNCDIIEKQRYNKIHYIGRVIPARKDDESIIIRHNDNNGIDNFDIELHFFKINNKDLRKELLPTLDSMENVIQNKNHPIFQGEQLQDSNFKGIILFNKSKYEGIFNQYLEFIKIESYQNEKVNLKFNEKYSFQFTNEIKDNDIFNNMFIDSVMQKKIITYTKKIFKANLSDIRDNFYTRGKLKKHITSAKSLIEEIIPTITDNKIYHENPMKFVNDEKRSMILKKIIDPAQLSINKDDDKFLVAIIEGFKVDNKFLGLSGRESSHGELRGQLLINKFAEYMKENPDKNLYSMLVEKQKVSKGTFKDDWIVNAMAKGIVGNLNLNPIISEEEIFLLANYKQNIYDEIVKQLVDYVFKKSYQISCMH